MDTIYQQFYPFEGHYFERNGLKLHYLDEGQGEVIVMVHGNPTWSFYYREVVKAVRGQYRAIVPDHIGCGLSDKPGDDQYTYTLRSRVDDLEALLAHLGVVENVTLLAHDWGGMIAMAYAHRHPERVKRIALMNTGAFTMPAGKTLPGLLRLVRDSALGAYLVEEHNFFAVGATYLGVTAAAMGDELRRAYIAPYDTPANRIATLRFVQDIPLEPDDPAWAIVAESEQKLAAGAFRETPVLLCWGMKDFVFDKLFLKQFRRYWPQAEVWEFPSAGHYVLEEQGPEIIERLVDWLGRNPVR